MSQFIANLRQVSTHQQANSEEGAQLGEEAAQSRRYELHGCFALLGSYLTETRMDLAPGVEAGAVAHGELETPRAYVRHARVLHRSGQQLISWTP